MKKTLIANSGRSGQGKSETLKKVIELLEKMPGASSNRVIDGPDKKVYVNIGNIKIGIETQGDPGSRLSESLEEFEVAECIIIICATRTDGNTVNAVNSMAGPDGYDIIWVTNHRSYEKDTTLLNEMSAKQIVGLVEELMANRI